MNTFLFKHSVDLSLLTNGFNIQTEMHPLVYNLPGGALQHGQNREIQVIIQGETFKAKLYNIGFDKQRYPDHPDLLQVRYSPASPIARKLQAIFMEDYNHLLFARQQVGPRYQISLPEGNRDEVVFYGTMQLDVFLLECFTTSEINEAADSLRPMSELDFETFTPIEDPNAGIHEVTRTQRIRHLDRSIGDSLKQLYDYRCQVTGEKIGDQYAVEVVEAHHISPFTISMNNDTSNIVILSPSFHRIVHAAKPTFNYQTLSFDFPNGISEKLKLNKHLQMA